MKKLKKMKLIVGDPVFSTIEGPTVITKIDKTGLYKYVTRNFEYTNRGCYLVDGNTKSLFRSAEEAIEYIKD
jgi:hypothetical protein